MAWLITFGYTFALLIICIFSLEQLYLAWLYSRSEKQAPSPSPLVDLPMVTVQLPVYNERYVVERLIDSVCRLSYPQDLLEIQVLDDSTDDTQQLISKKVAAWQAKGIDIKHVRRQKRIGYKAGALQNGLLKAKGEFIAIFDADFLPQPDFLVKTLPSFTENTGMVQTRWGHINQDYSMLTQMQAFGLNAHFTVEQTGRNSSGKLMNFNGTGGVWRKSCIEDAGGWQHDTLTEDLDLSYRAQLKGWKFKYLENVLAPAELPVLVPAIKSQQYRWNKGAAETARKNIYHILKSNLSVTVKLHAVMHLLNSSVFLFLFIAAVLSIPMLFIEKTSVPGFLWHLGKFFFVGFFAVAIFYWVAAKASTPKLSFKHYLIRLPLFLIFSMGLSLHNALAVAEGYLGIKTPFIRTPKFNITTRKDSWQGNIYLKKALSPLTFMEGLLTIYFIFGLVSGILLQAYDLLFFHLMLAAGFGAVFFLSLKTFQNAKAG